MTQQHTAGLWKRRTAYRLNWLGCTRPDAKWGPTWGVLINEFEEFDMLVVVSVQVGFHWPSISVWFNVIQVPAAQ